MNAGVRELGGENAVETVPATPSWPRKTPPLRSLRMTPTSLGPRVAWMRGEGPTMINVSLMEQIA